MLLVNVAWRHLSYFGGKLGIRARRVTELLYQTMVGLAVVKLARVFSWLRKNETQIMKRKQRNANNRHWYYTSGVLRLILTISSKRNLACKFSNDVKNLEFMRRLLPYWLSLQFAALPENQQELRLVLLARIIVNASSSHIYTAMFLPSFGCVTEYIKTSFCRARSQLTMTICKLQTPDKKTI